jgi:hypothetical protein
VIAIALALVAFTPRLSSSSDHSYSYGTDGDLSWALLGGGNQAQIWLTGEHHSDDWERLSDLSDRESREVLWFDLRGSEYLIRDGATVAETRRLVGPLQEIGAEQGEVGRQQGALGIAQARVGVRQSLLGQRLGRIARDLARDDPDATVRRDLERERDEVQSEMNDLAARQAELLKRQEPLRRRQQELGERQRSESRRVSKDLRRITETAIRDGRAIPYQE